MKNYYKKEVSNRGMQGVIDSLIEKKFDMNIFLDGIPYDLAYLKNRHERIEWWVYCKIISNLRPYFTKTDFENMNRRMVSRGKYFEGVLFGFFLFGSNKLARLFHNQIWKLGEFQFSNIKQKTEFLDKNKIRIYAILDEGYEFPVEFAYFTKGAWDEFASIVNRKGFDVDFTLTKQLITFIVSWDKEGFFFRSARVIQWFFNIKRALFEVTNTHAELLQQYNQLQESKLILEKQTMQLKTAYEIATQIKQTLQIRDTLKVITDTLVKAAGFNAVMIELNKDIEDNDLSIKVQSGAVTEFNMPIHREVIVNDKHLGDIIAYPSIQMDYSDVNDLVDYLTPVINIAIHDALVYTVVVEYRDNLEQKVTDRTSELQKARDKLSETNKMLKEAHQSQNRFFTNISHEFRTPLTLILGPAKQLSEQLRDENAKIKADLIHRSAKKLNRLVDELLDISKIEAGEMKLRTIPINLVAAVKEIALSFSSLSEKKNISFKIDSYKDEIVAYVDKDKFDKIITNVLSNAFKFTPEGGSVEVMINSHPELASGSRSKFIEISIRDTGMGIAQDQLDKIFDRFYQVDGSHTRSHEGTGIGLSLTKELIKLHQGRIEIESKEGKGSTFRLYFLLGKEHLKPEEICTEALVEEYEQEKFKETLISEVEDSPKKKLHIAVDIESREKSDKPILLIVEDNPDVRKYITIILGNQYEIFEASDGEEGLNKSFNLIPDLIISDIMMPKMDGFQLCRQLKTDLRTSHIPVIMLTAKATMQDKINGLDIGADEYIMKPFDAEELRARIRNLLEQRKRLHEHFNKYGFVDTEQKNISSADQQFLAKVVNIIDENIPDTSFGVEVLSEKIAVSHSLLYKKIISLTGTSPRELIKKLRLNKAAKLIESNTGNISEIALEVGFNNPSYFAECFHKQFGVAPSQYHHKS